jgi:MFS family permease
MAARVFYGWNIVIVCFLIALFGWGIGFYGPGIYLVSLRALHGWSTSLVSSAVTMYYLLSATFIIFIGDAFERFGPRRVVPLGSLAMGGRRGWAHHYYGTLADLCDICRHVGRLGVDERRCHQQHYCFMV